MEDLHKLIDNLALCIPQLDTKPLYASCSDVTDKKTIINWLYNQLNKQGLMVYKEWSKYSGSIPELKPVANLLLPAEPADYILSIIQSINWEASSIEPLEIPYCMPWLEHINHYIKPHHLRLVELLPFDNAYIICLYDDEDLIRNLDISLQNFGMGLSKRESLNQLQVSDRIDSILYE